MAKTKTIIIFLAIFFGFLGLARDSLAATINAASCSYSDVLTAYNTASAGDTVSIPSGSCTWSSTLNINKSLYLIGAGVSNTKIINNGSVSPLININLSSDAPVRVSGIRFDSTANEYGIGVQVSGKTNGSFGYTKIRIDNNYFDAGGRSAGQINVKGWVYGVAHDNTFLNYRRAAVNVDGDWHYSWDRGVTTVESGKKIFTPGTSQAFFIEDNDFILNANAGFLHSTVYSAWGARWVFRYNTMDSHLKTRTAYEYYALDSHGNQALYPNTMRGNPLVEIYGNTDHVYNDAEWIGIRSGSALVYNNTVTAVSGTPYIKFIEQETYGAYGIPEDDIYPCEDQIHNTFVWGNSGLNTIIEGNSQTVVQFNKNIFQHAPESSGGWEYYTNRMGAAGNGSDGTLVFSSSGPNAYYPYTSYTYPHPLRAEAAPPDITPPAAPTGVTVI